MGQPSEVNSRTPRSWPIRLLPLVGTIALGLGTGLFGARLLMETVPSHARSATRTAWLAGGGPSQRAREVLDLLRNASVDGLEPDRYAVRRLDRLADSANATSQNSTVS